VGVVKPDIVFFGENLPEKFYVLPHRDFAECDLLIIMGTSLTVQPFAGLVDYASDECVRLLINREKVGGSKSVFFRAMMFGEGLCFDLPGNRRDVALEGDCDDGVLLLAEKLGFAEELQELIKAEHAKIDAQEAEQASKEKKSSKSDEVKPDAEGKPESKPESTEVKAVKEKKVEATESTDASPTSESKI
jgi:NAD+-dependent protein deacetylase sirtuin 2